MGISVVLPNYNDAAHLPRALGALLRQQPPVDEIIVVDDGSTDNSIEVIEAFQRDHDNIRIIRHTSNLGAPQALNTGLAEAKADLVYFAAADDLVLPGFFALAQAAMDEYPAAAYFCALVVQIDTNGDIIGFRPLLPPVRGSSFVSPDEVRRLIVTIDNWAIGPSVVHRRRILTSIGGFELSLGSLCDGMTYRQMAFHHGFYFSNHLVAAWEVRPDSYSAKTTALTTENSQLIETAKAWIKQSFPSPINAQYPELFERRLRFNLVRESIMKPAGILDTDSIAGVAGLGKFDSAVLSLFGKIPGLSRIAILTWVVIRLRPFGAFALARSFIYLIGSRHSRRLAAQLRIAEATRPFRSHSRAGSTSVAVAAQFPISRQNGSDEP